MAATANAWSSFGTKEYYIESNKTHKIDYSEAKSECKDFGGILASITSFDIQQYLKSKIPFESASNETVRKFWIGAHRNTQNSSWMWQDNEALNYTNWETGEGLANETSTDEHCGSIFSNFQFKWFSSNCVTNYFGYICQRDAIAETTTTTTVEDMTTSTNIQTQENSISSTSTTINNFIETTTKNEQGFLSNDFPIVNIIVPVIVGILILCAIIYGVVLYRRKYRKSTTWEHMETPHVTDDDHVDNTPTPLPTTNVLHIEEHDPSALVTFRNEDHTFANPTYTHYEIPIKQKKPVPIPPTASDEYVQVYSSSSKSKTYADNYTS